MPISIIVIKTKEPTIKGVIKDLKRYYKPEYEYKRCGNKYEPYEKPQDGFTLIPPRILLLIANSGNSLQWKIDTLNEREKAYRRLLRASEKRIYPLWVICAKCKKMIAIEFRGGRKTRCYRCNERRFD